MKITYDPAKNSKNIENRGLSFDKVVDRVHALVYSRIDGGIRVISFRKANKREVKIYEIKTKS